MLAYAITVQPAIAPIRLARVSLKRLPRIAVGRLAEQTIAAFRQIRKDNKWIDSQEPVADPKDVRNARMDLVLWSSKA